MLEDVAKDDFINSDIKEHSNVGSPASELLPDELVLSKATLFSGAFSFYSLILLSPILLIISL